MISSRLIEFFSRSAFSLVFGFEYEVGNRNKLKSLTDKFRPIENFLKGESDLSDIETINITALLVDFRPRPFRLFASKSFENESLKREMEIIKIVKPENDIKDSTDEIKLVKPKNNLKKKILIGFVGLLGLGSIGYTAKSIILHEPQCMQWQNNHYEVVDCDSNKQSLLKQYDIIPFDEDQSKLIKVEVSDTTTFFKNGKSLYWYCKVNGNPEFFNTHGEHPETGKALKQVSEYIVKKYIKKE